MITVRFLREARRELTEAAQWYKQKEGLPLARDFGTNYRAQLQRARQMPKTGHLVTGLPTDIDFEVRKFRFERFPYTLLVAHLPDELVVVAVAHQHRRPGYWRKRLAKVKP
jgi:plasmid stabilization system protein ParE